MAIRCSYNEVNGVPACANPWLLETVARGEWGFDGYVTGQYHTTRPLAPPYSLHTVLLKVGSYKCTAEVDLGVDDPRHRTRCGVDADVPQDGDACSGGSNKVLSVWRAEKP